MSTIKKIFKGLGIIFLVLFLMGVVVACYFGYKFYPEYENMKENARITVEQIDDMTFRRLEPTQIVRAKEGELVREFTPLEYEYIEYENIPAYVKQSFISIEDKRFYKHDGVDYKAILRATVSLIKNKGNITQGGSTITQQLVKLTFLTQEQSYSRKLNEIFISWELEKNFDKNKILEYYINNIYFGNGAYGFETAANHYFSKTSQELTLAEITFLSSIPNNPTIFDPMNNKENTHKRQKLILQNMLEDEIIDETQYNQAINEDIVLNIKEKSNYVPENFEVSFIIHSAIELLMEKEGFPLQYNLNNEERKVYEKEYNDKYIELNNRIRQGGYTITSTIDPVKQNILQNSVNQGLQGFSAMNNNLYQVQGASVIINNETHEVEAVVGGRTAENQVNTFNRAILSYRQPGSIMKPIAAYGVEADIELLGFSKYQDVKDSKGPKNSNHKYKGTMTAREALERSVNTIPFDLMKKRGPRLAHQYLHKMRFTKIVEEDNNAGIAIGGFTYGVTPFELAGAFGTLANNGEYIRPLGVSEIKFNDEIIFKNEKKGVQVYKSNSAYLMTDIMKGVLNEPWGTGKRQKLNSMPAAGKTGTTDNNKDGWFAGYTPYYTMVVWVGNDSPQKVNNLFGGTYPGSIWKNVMEEIHKGLEVKDFEVPLGIETVYVNSKGKAYDYQKSGTKRELLTAHLADSIDVFDKNNIGRIQKKEEEERIRQQELARKIKEEEFFVEHGVTLASEEQELRILKQKIRDINTIYIQSLDKLNEVLDKLDDITYEVYVLKDISNQDEVLNEIRNAELIAENEYKRYLEELKDLENNYQEDNQSYPDYPEEYEEEEYEEEDNDIIEYEEEAVDFTDNE